jgi:HemY protein
MWKIIIRIAVIALVAAGFVWLADRPGSVNIDWLGYAIEIPIFVALLGLLLAVGLIMILFAIARRVFAAPGAVTGFFSGRRKKKAYEALTKGIVAVGAGDAGLATKFANKAAKLNDNDPLSQLLSAQAAQLRGDRATVTRVFENMTKSPDTEVLGLRGLFTQARQDGDMEKARALAERTVAKNPDLPWASRAMLALQSAEQNWTGAARTLENQRRAGTITKAEEDRRRAVVLAAQATALEDSDVDEALSLAERAHKLAPDLVPAAVIAARILASRANTRKAARILEKTWKLSPHPDVAEVYAFLRAGDSPQDRQTRISALIGKSSGGLEGSQAMARAAIDAQDWRDARKALSAVVEKRPPVRVCELMAEIEEGEYGDKGKAREWLARAVHAPRDPVWVADGHVSNTWQPMSPVTGELDAFEWKIPVEALVHGGKHGGKDDIVAEEISEMVEVDVAAPAPTPTPEAAKEPEPETLVEVTEDEVEVIDVPASAVEEPKVEPETEPEPEETVAKSATDDDPVGEEPASANGHDSESETAKDAPAKPAGKKTKPARKTKSKAAGAASSRQPDDPGPQDDTAV